MTKKYEGVNLPFSACLVHNNLTKKQLDEYFTWFLRVKDDRLKYLSTFVFDSPGGSLTSERFVSLQYFMRDYLTTIPKTEEEIKTERENLPEAIRKIHKIKEYKFTPNSFSIMFDVGVYWGCLMKQTFPDLHWGIILSDVTHVKPNISNTEVL